MSADQQATDDLIEWLRAACAGYSHKPVAVYRGGTTPSWPIHAESEEELQQTLMDGGHFVPLPKEPAALANIIEVALVEYLRLKIEQEPGIESVAGTERGYPDLEVSGPRFGGSYHAVDIKAARRDNSVKRTKSRITLYTGNTYFRHPSLHWPGTMRPYGDYTSHIDIITIYTFDETSLSRLRDLEIIVQESWRIGSKKRSSTTREYIGAVDRLEDLRQGHGEFEAEEEFYKYWRSFKFKITEAIDKQLKKLTGGDN